MGIFAVGPIAARSFSRSLNSFSALFELTPSRYLSHPTSVLLSVNRDVICGHGHSDIYPEPRAAHRNIDLKATILPDLAVTQHIFTRTYARNVMKLVSPSENLHSKIRYRND